VELVQRQAEFAVRFNLSLDEYQRIVRACNTQEIIAILELFKVRSHRSPARRFAHEQVKRWLMLNLPGKPLRDSQFRALIPKWPVLYQLPTNEHV
jgi:hypothetical protein